MQVVVTGAAGRLGRLVVDELLELGCDVLGVDRVRGPQPPGRFLTADLTEADAVYDVLRGADAVIHLGAIPGPRSSPASTTFKNNVLSTYYVAEAAAALGLTKLVFASSIFTLGWVGDGPLAEPSFQPSAGLEKSWPQYVPVDEEHPMTPLEAYGLSKQVGEDICAQVSRRSGMTAVSLRIMNVVHLAEGRPAAPVPWPRPTPERNVPFGMWPYVDARDAAHACCLALTATTRGHDAVFIAAADTRFDAPTEELLKELAPAHVEVRSPLPGNATVIDLGKAKRLIGFEPRYRWAAASM